METQVYYNQGGINQRRYHYGRQILGEQISASMDDRETMLNNNVMLIGSPGSGKTTLLKANLMEATGSYIISDPKSQLYKEFKGYLEGKGYRVLNLNFKSMKKGESAHFNPFHYIRDEDDILKMSTLLSGQCINRNDPFWDQATNILYNALISYLVFECDEPMRNLRNLISMINMASTARDADAKSELDFMFDRLSMKNPGSYALRQYQRYRAMSTKTLLSVLITAQAKLASFDTPAINELTGRDDINIPSIGERPTAVFVSVSDTDRSLDGLAGLFFSTCIQELVRFADEQCEGGRLPIPTRLFMDDFATNLKIDEYPRIITSIRSRNISSWVIIQSKGQLEKGYGNDADTILGACDHVIYQGGNDLATAKYIAERCNCPVSKVLGMNIGQSIIITRGSQTPVYAQNYNIVQHRKELMPDRTASGDKKVRDEAEKTRKKLWARG